MHRFGNFSHVKETVKLEATSKVFHQWNLPIAGDIDVFEESYLTAWFCQRVSQQAVHRWRLAGIKRSFKRSPPKRPPIETGIAAHEEGRVDDEYESERSVSPPPLPEEKDEIAQEEGKTDDENLTMYEKNTDMIHHGVNRVVSEHGDDTTFVKIETKAVEVRTLNLSAREIREKRALGMSVAQSVASLRNDSKSMQHEASQYSFMGVSVPDEDPRMAIVCPMQ